jgi:seryl-tRNA synthetase
MDIELFRNKPDEIRESQKRRFPINEKSDEKEIETHKKMVGLVDDVIELDNEWRKRLKGFF